MPFLSLTIKHKHMNVQLLLVFALGIGWAIDRRRLKAKLTRYNTDMLPKLNALITEVEALKQRLNATAQHV